VAEAFAVERVPDVPHEVRIDSRRPEGAHPRDDRPVHQILRGVDAHAPEAVAQFARDVEAGRHTIIVVVDQRDDLHLGIHVLGELLRRERGIAMVGGDESVRDRTNA
jgi:hypothetical protein